MDDPNHTESGLRLFLRRLVGSTTASLGRMLAGILISSAVLALVGGLLALCYVGWSAVPLGLGLGAAAGVVLWVAAGALLHDWY
jgi:hypothetical protein